MLLRLREVAVETYRASNLPWQLQVLLLLFITPFFIGYGLTANEDAVFSRLRPADHLRLALKICSESATPSSCSGHDRDEATRHLAAISSDAPEFNRASELSRFLQQQTATEDASIADHNFQGLNNDPFICSQSATHQELVSFNRGRNWWIDTVGKCAQREQRRRDTEAENRSYIPTKLRVETDIDSTWMQHEERICTTSPNDEGRVASVHCSVSEGVLVRTLPIVFWGGVDRNTVSQWKCEREDDNFTCKAID